MFRTRVYPPILAMRPRKKGLLHRAGVIPDGRQRTASPMNLDDPGDDDTIKDYRFRWKDR